MENNFTPISEIKKKLDEKNKPPEPEGFSLKRFLSNICDYLMRIIIPIIAFILVINPITFGKISGLSDVNFTANSALRTTTSFAGILILGNVLNYLNII